jgi:TM2 domain-containing membrane protein YozV
MSYAIEPRRQERTVGWALLLWLPCVFGVSGLHRFYTGRYISGLIWMLTGGLCGVGQVIDLFFISRMVSDHNDGRPVW